MRFMVIGKPHKGAPEQRRYVSTVEKGMALVARLTELRGWYEARVTDKPKRVRRTPDSE